MRVLQEQCRELSAEVVVGRGGFGGNQDWGTKIPYREERRYGT